MAKKFVKGILVVIGAFMLLIVGIVAFGPDPEPETTEPKTEAVETVDAEPETETETDDVYVAAALGTFTVIGDQTEAVRTKSLELAADSTLYDDEAFVNEFASDIDALRAAIDVQLPETNPDYNSEESSKLYFETFRDAMIPALDELKAGVQSGDGLAIASASNTINEAAPDFKRAVQTLEIALNERENNSK